jgi:hypothetical protein
MKRNEKALQKIQKALPKTKTISDEIKSSELTTIETKLIIYWIGKKKNTNLKIPTIIPISKDVYIDFIGWDREDLDDLIICDCKKVIRSCF